jgi:adenylylsulfate kinase
MRREGFTIWFTGLSGAGKTTLAIELETELRKRNILYVQRLDGDIVRQDLTRDLGYSKEDRNENIRRVTFVAELLSKNGVATLVSFISPYRKAREIARNKCHKFIEIFVQCDMDILIARDVKGFYKKALNNDIRNFTGINDPYEEPESPELIINTTDQTVEESVRLISSYLENNGLI